MEPQPYKVELSRAARKQLDDLPPRIRRQVRSKIDLLTTDPRPPGSKVFEGSDGLRRIRSGSYRIVYTVVDRVLTVLVVKAGDRKAVYRDLP